MHTTFRLESIKERDHLRDLVMDGGYTYPSIFVSSLFMVLLTHSQAPNNI